MLEVSFCAHSKEQGKLRINAERMRGFTRVVPSTISVCRTHDSGRRDAEDLIERAYARSYGSKIGSHYPNLMTLSDGAGVVLAAVGFRVAKSNTLFLEQYLRLPVESAIEEAAGVAVAREQIVEIGSLASSGRGASLYLFVALAAFLQRNGFLFAVATATEVLQKTFTLFGFELIALGGADQAVLPDGGASWGSYYASNPRVVAGAIVPGCARLERYLPIQHNATLDLVFSYSDAPAEGATA